MEEQKVEKHSTETHEKKECVCDFCQAKKMRSYRCEFGGNIKHFWKDFIKMRNVYPYIGAVFNVLTEHGIKNKWFFFEPYVEITWLAHEDDGKVTMEKVEELLRTRLGPDNYKMIWPTEKNPNFADWYCESLDEKIFGAMAYKCTSEIAILTSIYEGAIKNGKGLEGQFQRRIHALANQCGLNYYWEGKFALKRGVFCLLIRFFALGIWKPFHWMMGKIRKDKWCAGPNKMAMFICNTLLRWKMN